jgi:hypothetical protein
MNELNAEKETNLENVVEQDTNPTNATSQGSDNSRAVSLMRQESDQDGESATIDVSSTRKGKGGPRTQLGKQKSKRNALKDGIYSAEVLLKGEPSAKFYSMLEGLQDDFDPQGTHERLLVEWLAVLSWRKRRVLIAERAEIRKREFFEVDEKRRQLDMAAAIPEILLKQRGLVRYRANPEVLRMCIDQLEILKQLIEKKGLNEVRDGSMLARVYGEGTVSEHWMFNLYRKCLIGATNSSLDGQSESPSPQDFINHFLQCLEGEIKEFNRSKNEQSLTQWEKTKIDFLRANVPDLPQCERIMKAETSLDRAIDKTLNRLDRAQSERKGLAVAPTVNVNVTP